MCRDENVLDILRFRGSSLSWKMLVVSGAIAEYALRRERCEEVLTLILVAPFTDFSKELAILNVTSRNVLSFRKGGN